jgi:hypothetical protein
MIFAAQTASGALGGRVTAWHAAREIEGRFLSLCGRKVFPEADRPIALLFEEPFVSGGQYVECDRCVKAMKGLRR